MLTLLGPQRASHMVRCEKPSLLMFTFEKSRFQGGKLEKKKVRPFHNNPYGPMKILETSLKFNWKPPSLLPKKELYTANNPFCWDEKWQTFGFTIPPKYLVVLFRLFTKNNPNILSVPWLHAPAKSGLLGLWLTLTYQNITLLRVFHETYVPS